MTEQLLLTPLVDILKQDQGSDPTCIKDFCEYVENRNTLCLKEHRLLFKGKNQLETSISRIYK